MHILKNLNEGLLNIKLEYRKNTARYFLKNRVSFALKQKYIQQLHNIIINKVKLLYEEKKILSYFKGSVPTTDLDYVIVNNKSFYLPETTCIKVSVKYNNIFTHRKDFEAEVTEQCKLNVEFALRWGQTNFTFNPDDYLREKSYHDKSHIERTYKRLYYRSM